MEVVLSDEQEMLRSTTRSFLESQCPLSVVRSLSEDPLGYDPAIWRRGAELGWTSLLVDEADGGGSLSEQGISDLAVVAEELGRVVAPGPLVPTNVVASALGSWAELDERRRVLGEILCGASTAAWTTVGPDGIPGVTASGGDGTGELVLDGEVPVVEEAPGARWLLVSAGDGGGAVPDGSAGVTQVLVPADTAGVSIEALGGLDLVRRFGAVTFDRVVVPSTAVVGARGAARPSVAHQLAVAVVLQCAETVGAITEIFARTLGYLGDRYSFGRPLASYQALKHRCADLELAIQRCSAIASAACRAVAAGASDSDEMVSIAKAFIGPVATELVQDCVQLHGGIGVTWDHDLHLYLRRVTVNRATYGTPEEHLERIARAAFPTVPGQHATAGRDPDELAGVLS